MWLMPVNRKFLIILIDEEKYFSERTTEKERAQITYYQMPEKTNKSSKNR